MGHKGHWGEYTGNAKWSRDHAHTRVTSKNYDDAVKDDAAHIDYLKRDIIYDAHHGHSDEKMTADEKHISKLAGDMKYDKKHHSPAKNKVEGMTHAELAEFSENRPMPASGKTGYERHMEMHNSAAEFNPGLVAAAKDESNDMNDKFRQKVLAAGPGNNSKGMPFLGIGKKKSMPDFDYEDPYYKDTRQYKKFDRKQKSQERRPARKEKRNAAAEMHCMGKKK